MVVLDRDCKRRLVKYQWTGEKPFFSFELHSYNRNKWVAMYTGCEKEARDEYEKFLVEHPDTYQGGDTYYPK